MAGATTFLGVGRSLIPIPAPVFRFLIGRAATSQRWRSQRQLTPNHHRVRDHVVLEIARRGVPASPSRIARNLDLSIEEVLGLLDDLESWKVYMYREAGEDVIWAYPGTVATTPHHLTWSTGEASYAA